MNQVRLLVASLILSICVNAQSVTFNWAKKIGGSLSESGKAIKVDASGNSYIIGDFEGTVDFDPSTTSSFTLTSNGSVDFFISKLDVSGNFVWAKQIGGVFPDRAESMDIDATGNVYVSGIFNGTVDFDPNGGVVNLSTVGSSIDAFVLKMSGAGNLIWAKKFGGTMDEAAQAVTVDLSGNVYTTGYFQGTCDFDPNASTVNLVGISTNDNIFISKLNSSGAYVWAKLIGGSVENYGSAIKTDALGNVYTAGYFSGTSDFNPGATVLNLTSNGLQDAFISKLDATGNFVWAKNFGGTGDDKVRGISIDASNNIYTVGDFYNAVDFDPSSTASYTLASFGLSDGFIHKLDQAGTFVFCKSFGGVSYDYPFSVKTDLIGNIYFGGAFYSSTVDFDPSALAYNITSVGFYDGFICKLNTLGDLYWVKKIGGISDQLVRGIDVDLADNVYSTGNFVGNTDFNLASSAFTITSNGSSSDVFVHKMSLCAAPSSPINTTSTAQICANTSTTLSATATGTINWFSAPTSTTILSSGSSYTTMALTAGTYTYYAEASTCTVSASRTAITVTVNPIPTITVNSGSICTGNSFTISPTGASSYIYSTGSAIVSPTTNTTYIVLGSSVEGCTNTAITSVSVNTLPTVNISSSNSLICIGQTVNLTANGASTYLWNTSSTGSTSAISPTTTTSYTVVGTDVYGCENTATITQSVSTCTSLQNIDNEMVILIFPNPTSGVFNLKFDLFNEAETTIEITNSLGQVYLSQTLKTSESTINLSSASKGIYFAKVFNHKKQIVVKVIKN